MILAVVALFSLLEDIALTGPLLREAVVLNLVSLQTGLDLIDATIVFLGLMARLTNFRTIGWG
jgi:hypothetical protein